MDSIMLFDIALCIPYVFAILHGPLLLYAHLFAVLSLSPNAIN